MDRMVLKLFLGPLFLLIAASAAMFILGNAIPSILASAPLLREVASLSRQAAPWAGLALFLWALAWGANSSYKLWRWQRGEIDTCHQCGCITNYIPEGRYGPYYKCLGCGKNRSAS